MQLRMKKLEEIRLEVDSRRRTVQDLAQKVRPAHPFTYLLRC